MCMSKMGNMCKRGMEGLGKFGGFQAMNFGNIGCLVSDPTFGPEVFRL